MTPQCNKNGFTLIEAIIVVALMGIIMAAVFPMLHFSNRAQQVVYDEYSLQSDMRHTSESITQTMRYATVGFTMTQAQLDASSPHFKNGWSYIFLSADKRTVNHVEWRRNPDGSFSHATRVLVEAQSGVSYNLTFKQDHVDSNTLRFTLDGFYNNSDTTKMTISSEVLGLNALVINDAGSESEPAVALAYRNDATPTPQNLRVAVTMVLDESRSMSFKMGGTGSDRNVTRNNILQHEAKKVIDLFSDMGYVDVAIIPFSASATDNAFIDSSTGKVALKQQIDNLTPNGATNTGEAMRRGYHLMTNYNSAYLATHLNSRVLNYMILLTDGNPTLYIQKQTRVWESHWWGGRWVYYDIALTDGYFTEESFDFVETRGTGSSDNDGLCLAYTAEIGKDLILNPSGIDMKTIGIGFTGDPDEVNRVRTIAETYCDDNVPRDEVNWKGKYYGATDSAELAAAFQSIQQQILSDVWHIYGPY